MPTWVSFRNHVLSEHKAKQCGAFNFKFLAVGFRSKYVISYCWIGCECRHVFNFLPTHVDLIQRCTSF